MINTLEHKYGKGFFRVMPAKISPLHFVFSCQPTLALQRMNMIVPNRVRRPMLYHAQLSTNNTYVFKMILAKAAFVFVFKDELATEDDSEVVALGYGGRNHHVFVVSVNCS
jgi:hypothetical protein